MSFVSPWWLGLGALAIPVIVMHMLKPRRQRVEVSSIWLWRPAATQVTARRPWQKLQKSWPLLLQLLAVAALAIGAAQPVTNAPTTYGRHTVFILDNSVSMTTREAKATRFELLQRKAKSLRDKLPGGALASIVTTDGTVRLSTSDDANEFNRIVSSLQPTAGAVAMDRAGLLSKGLQTAERDTGFVLISDGQLSEPEQRLLPAGVRFEPIGDATDNVSISDPIVTPQSSGLSVGANVRNRSALPANVAVVLQVDGVEKARKRLRVEATGTVQVSFAVTSGEKIALKLADLKSADNMSADDQAFVTAGERRKINVQLVTNGDPGSLFIERALQALPNVTVTAGQSTTIETKADVVVYDRVQPTDDLAVAAVVIAPPKGYGPVTIKQSAPVEFPIPTLVRSTNPLLVGLDLSNVVIEESQSIDPGDAQVLVGAPNAALIVQGRTDRNRFVYWSFSPAASTIALDLAFPVLVDRMISDLGGASVTGGAVDVGSTLAPAAEDRMLTNPAGTAVAIRRGETSAPLDAVGFWKVEGKSSTIDTIAVNTPSSEMDIAPKSQLVAAPQDARAKLRNGLSRSSQLRWVIIVLLLLVVAEWWLVRKRVGVRPRQWKGAQVARALVAVLGLVALISPILRLPTRDVATVFAIDASDSLGPAGRRDAVAFVETALASMPKSSRAGVVVFGGTAQVTAAVQRQLAIGDVSSVIDASNTDLAGALRLSAAASPTDAARRVVLISDGRRTIGDEAAAAQELAAAKIRLDVAVAGRAGTADVAVDSFRVPAKAQQGERLVLRANLRATEAMTTEVILKADGKEIARQSADLQVGDNAWSVELSAATNGVATYSLEVVSQRDTVVQNDVGYAATAIEGTTRVLVLKGDSDTYAKGGNGADAIATSLRGSGLEVITKRASELDGLDDLAGVSAVVMVDVHRRELNAAQVDTLTGAVRELGVGLTVVGGTNSFGSGGYLGSKLEELLPVVSEVADPKRRTPVAQAIIIDTSGSMSAPVDAKRTALDLAKAGALGAVGALSKGDKVGVVGVDDDRQWVLDVQDLPSYDTAKTAISKLQVGGGTVIEGSLTEAAAQLQAASASVRHILVLSDGYTSDPNALIAEAATLRAQGITVTVVGAGTDIEPSFGKVAAAGGGRFVPGGDFANLPSIFVEETQTVARNLVNEGDFVPDITSSAAAVQDLQSAPAIKGFQATTPRPTARTALRVGPFKDPLLTSWQAGLGKVSVWSSDGGQRWAAGWSSLPQPFWSAVVKDTILTGGAGTVRAAVEEGRLAIRAVGPNWGTGATAVATIRSPTGDPVTVQLRRTSDGAYVGEADAPNAGTYAIGVTVKGEGAAIFKGGATAIRGYSAEYEPGNVDRERLTKLSQRTKGRGVITATQVFDSNGLVAGRRLVNLVPWLLGAAAVLWVLSIALWRVPFGKMVLGQSADARRMKGEQSSQAARPATVDRTNEATRSARPSQKPNATSSASPTPAAQTAPSEPAPPKSDLQELLKAARERRGQ